MVKTDKSKGPGKKTASSGERAQFRLALPPVLDISAAKEFHIQLKDAVSGVGNGRVVFEADKVERITTPGMQLLVAAAKTIQGNKGTVAVANPSDIFCHTLTDLGLTAQLNEWKEGNG